MKNPHVAADGFSYELEAVEEWLWTGHNTSTMTHLRLDHKFLTPNHTLRSLIRDAQVECFHGMPLEDQIYPLTSMRTFKCVVTYMRIKLCSHMQMSF